MARDVRETKVHYSPSEKDGVFVVEVARGADSNTTPIQQINMNNNGGATVAMTTEQIFSNAVSLQAQQSAIVEMPEEQMKTIDYESSNDGIDHASCSKSNEQVLVHPPPNGICNDDDILIIDEDGSVSMSSPKFNGNNYNNNVCDPTNVNTGLSQSDLSVSSSDGSNRAYCYGTQEPYTVDTQGYQSLSPHLHTIQVEQINITPEPITVISDNVEHANQINENDSQSIVIDDFNVEPLPIDSVNENENNVAPLAIIDNAITIKMALKTNIEIENGNIQQTETIHQNGFKSNVILNGKLNGEHKNGFNGNDISIDDSNEFDSLINLPAPPICDDIKQFTDVTALDNNNMDSLPPPPPECTFTAAEPINVES